MLKFYSTTLRTFINGTKVDTRYCNDILTDIPPVDKEIIVNWDNLDDVIYKYDLVIPFNCRHSKRGKIIMFWSNYRYGQRKLTRKIKEYKQADPGITIKIEYEEIQKPIADVLKWREPHKALQYLEERKVKEI